jgi:hypothetical protein
MRTLFLTVMLLALPAAAAETSAYERVAYPQGISPRLNEITGKEELPEFVLLSTAKVPKTNREVAVWAERLSKDLPYEKIYYVFAATFERDGDSLRLLDRREITDDVPQYLEFPGNSKEVRAMANVFDANGTTIAGIELWSSITGSGRFNDTSDLFFAMSGKGALTPALKLPRTYSSASSSGGKGATISTLRVSGNELIVATRVVSWAAPNVTPLADCGPATTKRYRFDGTTYAETVSATAVPSNAIELPRLSIEEKALCAN